MNLKRLIGYKKIRDNKGYVYYAKNGDTFTFTENASGVFNGEYDVVDCEHQGDLDYAAEELSEKNAYIDDMYWDGIDGGDAYVSFHANSVKAFMDIICDIYDGVSRNLNAVSDYLVEADTKDYHITNINGKLKYESKRGTAVKPKDYISDFINKMDKVFKGHYFMSADNSSVYLNFKCNQYYMGIDVAEDGIVLINEEYDPNNVIDTDLFFDALESVRNNDYLLTDSISDILGYPLYGEQGYNFTNNDGSAYIESVKGDLYLIYLPVEDTYEKIPVDEFDGYFKEYTGVSPDKIING